MKNGCEPEVIEEYTDSTETLLITFTPAKADKYPCVLNLAKYGIDMGDPTRVDTPQGDGTWKARTYHDTWWDLPDLNMSNLPSPDFVASANHYTPPQGFIEFDPAVRSAEFFYSRLLQERAIWRGVYGHYDSMLVQALDRAPGTVSYNLYDRKVLRSNVQSTSPPWNNWTHAKLASREGDKIQWLWFDGHLLIDNLKITRAPLTCGSFGSLSYAVRGYEVTCRVSGGKWSVTGWEFKPDGAGLPVVQDL